MKIFQKIIFISIPTFLLLLSGCGKKEQEATSGQSGTGQPSQTIQLQIAEIQELYPEAAATDSGLHYIVTETGSGEKPNTGQMVTAHYHGTLLNGEVFDSSIKRGRPFSFLVGAGRVIPGWDEAFLDMRKGEKRTLILPSNIAYGNRSAGSIPPNSVLVFDVELLDFK